MADYSTIEEDPYEFDNIRGFCIVPGEGVTPRDLNLRVLTSFFAEIPGNEVIAYVKRREDGKIFVSIHPGNFNVDFIQNLGGIRSINGFPVAIHIPWQLYYQLGVITHSELQYLTPQDWHHLLDDDTMKHVHLMEGSHTAILGFAKTPPETLKLGWDTVRVRAYVPRPKRCQRCQQYFHLKKDCRAAENICPRCAASGHEKNNCPAASPTCPACGEAHEISDNKCKVWKTQIKNTKQRMEEKKTYAAVLQKNYEDRRQQQHDDSDMEEEEDETQEEERKRTKENQDATRASAPDDSSWTVPKKKQKKSKKIMLTLTYEFRLIYLLFFLQ